ncbi:hypothetical protein ABTN83_19760, partial [Acinetobacter baumannii]
SSSIRGSISSGLVTSHTTTFPPTAKVPRMPGQHKGKLCAIGKAAKYILPLSIPLIIDVFFATYR